MEISVKMSLSTSVALSPTTYASLRSPSRRFHDEVLVGSATVSPVECVSCVCVHLFYSYHDAPLPFLLLIIDWCVCVVWQDLGPGFHDTTRAEAAVGRKQVVLPLPQSERFDRRTDPAKFLGSTYKLEQYEGLSLTFGCWLSVCTVLSRLLGCYRDSKVWNDVGFAAVKSERPPLNTSTPVDQVPLGCLREAGTR